MTKQLIAIWAEDENHLIGVDGGLPWHLPKELKHFKETTMGQALLMGRVTFDGMGRRVLPGRDTLVLPRDKTYQADGVTVVHSPEEVFQWLDEHDKDLYVVGGSHVYERFLPDCQTLIRTKVHATFTGDTYFPEVDMTDFKTVSETHYDKDEKNAYNFTITVLER